MTDLYILIKDPFLLSLIIKSISKNSSKDQVHDILDFVISHAKRSKGFLSLLSDLDSLFGLFDRGIVDHERFFEDLAKVESGRDGRLLINAVAHAIKSFNGVIGESVSWNIFFRSVPDLPVSEEGCAFRTFSQMPNFLNALFSKGIVSWETFVKDMHKFDHDKDEAMIMNNLFKSLASLILKRSVSWAVACDDIIEVSTNIDFESSRACYQVIRDYLSYKFASWPQIKSLLLKPGGAEILILSKRLYDASLLRRFDQLAHLDKLFSRKEFIIRNYHDMIFFLNLFAVRPQELKPVLKNILADLMAHGLSITQDQEFIEPLIKRLRESFKRAIHAKHLDRQTKFLLRRVAQFLPVGANGAVVNKARAAAVELQLDSQNLLLPIRRKIHSYPGREDVDIVSAYKLFLDTGNIAFFKIACEGSGIKVDFSKLKQQYVFLKEHTYRSAESLLKYLKQLWSFDPSDLKKQADSLMLSIQKADIPRTSLSLVKAIIKDIAKLGNCLAENRTLDIAKFVGDLRMQVKALEQDVEGDLKAELYYFELFLESLEQFVHPEVLKGLVLETWGDLDYVLTLVEQKSYALISTHHSHESLAEALHYISEFRKDKSVQTLSLALNHFQYAISFLNEYVLGEFRMIFRKRLDSSPKELEELTAPFTRTGPIFQLEQLVEFLRTDIEKGIDSKIRHILASVSRPITAHLRDRIYARFGL